MLSETDYRVEQPRTNTKRAFEDDVNYDFVHSHGQSSLSQNREANNKHQTQVNDDANNVFVYSHRQCSLRQSEKPITNTK